MAHLPPLPLSEGITSSYVDCKATTGLNFHILTSGNPLNPLLLFCHGYPELAYSWRHILPYFGAKGYYAVAFDQRGYGRTGWDQRSYDDVDLNQFGSIQNVIEVLALVSQLGRSHVDIIIGHDFGAVTAASCALMRPDFFRACVLMSHPFDAVPSMPGNNKEPRAKGDPDIVGSLAKIGRKHYKWANSTSTAAEEWDNPAQGLTSFLRGYFYLKSASDERNKPHSLTSWTADALAAMPHYYILKIDRTMAETVAEDTVGENVDKTKTWLPDEDLAVYVQEWGRTGFQGALNNYRNRTIPDNNMRVFASKKISVPTVFISGRQDWGNEQSPGAVSRLPENCEDFRGVVLIEGAGHWPQQEQPARVCKEIENFLSGLHK